jgi:hypothetical protein
MPMISSALQARITDEIFYALGLKKDDCLLEAHMQRWYPRLNPTV